MAKAAPTKKGTVKEDKNVKKGAPATTTSFCFAYSRGKCFRSNCPRSHKPDNQLTAEERDARRKHEEKAKTLGKPAYPSGTGRSSKGKGRGKGKGKGKGKEFQGWSFGFGNYAKGKGKGKGKGKKER